MFFWLHLQLRSPAEPKSRHVHGDKPLRTHALKVLGALSLWDPAHAVLREQLRTRLRNSVQRIGIIQDTSLDNPHALKGFTCSVKSGTAVAAEVGGDLLSRVGGLGDGLGRAAGDFEGGFGDDDVDGVGTT